MKEYYEHQAATARKHARGNRIISWMYLVVAVLFLAVTVLYMSEARWQAWMWAFLTLVWVANFLVLRWSVRMYESTAHTYDMLAETAFF